jgi:hypothetical protein
MRGCLTREIGTYLYYSEGDLGIGLVSQSTGRHQCHSGM